MARTRKKAEPRRSGGGSSKGASKARTPRATVDVVEEESGFGLEEGIVFFTTILVVAAFLFLDMARAGYGEGMFF
ncbi:MAG: hypothetical protein JKY61_10505 [Planctomycetes bacterium]|nr:hypothetical protein [Planctomycetota bacterium]